MARWALKTAECMFALIGPRILHSRIKAGQASSRLQPECGWSAHWCAPPPQGPQAHATPMGFRVCPRHAGGHTPDSHPQALSIFHYFALLVLLWVFGKTGGSSTTRPRPKDKQAHNATQSGKPKLPRGFTQACPRGGAPIILSERPRTLPGNRISIAHCGNPGESYRPEAARPPASSPSPPAIAPCIARACLVEGSASRQRRWVGEPPIHRPTKFLHQ